MAAELDALARQRHRLQMNLRHVDETLKLVGFDGDPAAIRGKRRYTVMFGRGEIKRLVLTAVREHGDKISHKEIAVIILQTKAWKDDGELLAIVTEKVRTARKNIRRNEPR